MPGIFDVKQQLVFYGAYHSNKWNVLIHICCVPLILWSSQVFLSGLPLPDFVPKFSIKLNDYASLESNWALPFTVLYQLYYFMLEPVAALLYLPQFSTSLLTATSFAHKSHGQRDALAVHIVSWILQFIGHGAAEGRAPALLDNLVGAVVLAPFFVHLELLFALGYRKAFHKDLNNAIGVEIANVRKAEAAKKRANGKKEF